MDLIVTHINADFDGLSSLVAGKKLYPGARLLLPGSQEKAVREFMSLSSDIIKIETEKECRLDNVNRLIIMDTSLAPRIGVAAKLLSKSGVEVHIYDHHPRTAEDIKADKEVYREVGATVTILADIIRRQKLHISPLEATIMALGIYEETGSLTYRTTSKKDVDTISFLLAKGANLNVVSSYLNRELSKEELSFLVNLIHSIEIVDINGLDVAIAAFDAEEYEGELSTMAHKLVEVENFKVLFLIAGTKSSVRVIARSRLPHVDVNKILGRFGGGGHPAASSAVIRNTPLNSVKYKLLEALKKNIKGNNKAGDIMNTKVKFFSPGQNILSVKKALERSRLECGLIKKGGRIKGIITLAAADKALERGRGLMKARSAMNSNFFSVGPDDPIAKAQRLIFEKKAGNILVIKNEKVVGVVSRTDVLKAIHAGLFMEPQDKSRARGLLPLNLAKRLKTAIPDEMIRLLRLIDKMAGKNNSHAFLVGGFVRDLLLGVRNLDLDIVVEGDAVKIVKGLIAETGGSYTLHHRFGTATALLDWPVKLGRERLSRVKVDFATARTERYEKPAALPTVEFSTVREDLARRDFTINAMAINISKENFGQLVDFFGGQKDLAHKKIKILHEGSFLDDPTRIFRAVRFEQRLNFRIEPRTETMIREAIQKRMIDRTQKQRLRDELILILKEEEPKKMIKRMEGLGELRFIHPKLRFTQKTEKFFNSIEEETSWFKLAYLKKRALDAWLMYLMALLDALSAGDIEKVCREFVFRKGERIRLLSYKKSGPAIAKFLNRPGKLQPSEIYKTLEPLSYEAMLSIMAKSQSRTVKKRISEFFTKYNGVKLNIKGRDLEEMGLRAGPRFKKVLTAVLYAKLDRGLNTKSRELEIAKRMINR